MGEREPGATQTADRQRKTVQLRRWRRFKLGIPLSAVGGKRAGDIDLATRLAGRAPCLGACEKCRDCGEHRKGMLRSAYCSTQVTTQ